MINKLKIAERNAKKAKLLAMLLFLAGLTFLLTEVVVFKRMVVYGWNRLLIGVIQTIMGLVGATMLVSATVIAITYLTQRRG